MSSKISLIATGAADRASSRGLSLSTPAPSSGAVLDRAWGYEIKGFYFRITDEESEGGPPVIYIPGGVAYLFLDLEIESAVFVHDPIQWFVPDGPEGISVPAPTPAGLRVERIDERRVVIASQNFRRTPFTLNFWILIYDQAQKRIREADPGIIFEPYQPPEVI